MDIIYQDLKQDPMRIDNYDMTNKLCLYAVKLNGFALTKIPKRLHTNEICLAAVNENGLALEYVSRDILSKQICIAAVENNGLAIKDVPENFLSRKIYNCALKQNGLSLQYISKERITSTRAMKSVSQNGLSLKYVPDKLLTKKMLESAVTQNAMSLEYVPRRRMSKKLCKIAIGNNPLSLKFVPNRYKSDELLETAYKKDWESFVYYPLDKYTDENCIDFLRLMSSDNTYTETIDNRLLNETVSKFPDKVNENLKVIKYERLLGIREFISKYYNSYEKVFYVVEKIHFEDSKQENTFKKFDDFCSHVDGDLSNADLSEYDFEGIELKNYNINNCIVNSNVLVKQGMYDDSFYKANIEQNNYYLDFLPSKTTEALQELSSKVVTDFRHIESWNQSRRFYYISDIHLDHKLKKHFPKQATKLEVELYINQVIEEILNNVVENTIDNWNLDYLLVAGDVSFKSNISRMFYTALKQKSNFENIVVILGNHEFWNFSDTKLSMDDVVIEYKKMFDEIGIQVLHNDLLLINDYSTKTITEEELKAMNVEDIEEKCLKVSNLIWGGTGFSSFNNEYNATSGIYRNVMKTLDQDIYQTNRFNSIYKKLKESLSERDLIVLTHTPKKDWSNDSYNSNWFYVNGHTHINVFIKDSIKSVYSDNQIGYYNEQFPLKFLEISKTYDIFKRYDDGKYFISRKQYKDFNRGLGIQMDFNRSFDKIHMLKRNGTYCFILEKGNKKYLLEGGMIHNLANQSIDYYYDNIERYSNALKKLISRYNQALNQISLEVKKFGGIGSIHGCIVDIDYYNHIYLDPVEGSINPYYATSIKDKHFYSSIQDLLLIKRKDLHEKYLSISSPLKETYYVENNNLDEVKLSVLIKETEMYEPSNLIKSIQYLTNCNVIRVWNEELIKNISLDIDLNN